MLRFHVHITTNTYKWFYQLRHALHAFKHIPSDPNQHKTKLHCTQYVQNTYHLYNSIKDWKEHRYNMKALQRQYAKTAMKIRNNILENNSLNAVNTIDSII